MCLKENGPRAQNMTTILGSVVNVIVDIHMTLMSTESSLDNVQDIYMRKVTTASIWNC